MSRAGAPLPVSPRPGVDAIKEVGGFLPAASSCAACIDTEGLEPVCAYPEPGCGRPDGLVPGGAARGS